MNNTRVIPDVDPKLAAVMFTAPFTTLRKRKNWSLPELLRGRRYTKKEREELFLKFKRARCVCGNKCPCHAE